MVEQENTGQYLKEKVGEEGGRNGIVRKQRRLMTKTKEGLKLKRDKVI